MPKVYNKHHGNAPPGAVYIGRPTVWGNPFPLTKETTREEVLEQYKQYLFRDAALRERARQELKGKDLVCWCAPHLCHGDVLLQIANEGEE
jgi:hypothetical protein